MPISDQGVSNDRYSIIPRTLIFMTRGDEVLLIKGAASKRLWANLYNGIGGHIDRGEDALSAAKRELYEETGLTGQALRLVGTVLIDAAEDRGIGLFVFSGIYTEGELHPSTEGQLEWVPVSQLDNYPLVEDLHILLPKILQTQNDAPPFSALYFYDERDQLRIVFGD